MQQIKKSPVQQHYIIVLSNNSDNQYKGIDFLHFDR